VASCAHTLDLSTKSAGISKIMYNMYNSKPKFKACNSNYIYPEQIKRVSEALDTSGK